MICQGLAHEKASTLSLNELTAVSPIDGRYAARTIELRELFSEFALIRERVRVELRWFIALGDHPGIEELPPVADDERAALLHIGEPVSYTHLTLPTILLV